MNILLPFSTVWRCYVFPVSCTCSPQVTSWVFPHIILLFTLLFLYFTSAKVIGRLWLQKWVQAFKIYWKKKINLETILLRQSSCICSTPQNGTHGIRNSRKCTAPVQRKEVGLSQAPRPPWVPPTCKQKAWDEVQGSELLRKNICHLSLWVAVKGRVFSHLKQT